jgi:phage I-like protein
MFPDAPPGHFPAMPSELQKLLSTATVARLAATLPPVDAAGSWMKLLPAGTFTARDGRGPFTTGDRAAMEKILADTLAYSGATELVIDYDHQSQFGAVEGVGGVAPAAGWIKELQVRDDGIYGRVEWTEKAAAAIKANEYRYLSPVMYHTKSGKVLILQSAALTNTPAFDLMATAASARFQPREPNMDKIAAALGLGQGSGEDAVLSALNALLATSTAIATAAGLKADAKPADVQAAVTAAFSDRGKLATAAGVAATATTDQIVTAISAFAAGGKPDPTKFVPIEQVQQLQADVKALKDGALGDKAEVAVASAIKEGKLVPALKQWGLDLYKADPAKFETFVGSSPVLTAPQLKTPAKDPAAGETLDAEQLAVCSALGIDTEKFKKTLADEAKEKETC